MRLVNSLRKAIAFLRAGYPPGVPPFGYVPLLALLPRRASEDEITAIAAKLTLYGRRPIGIADVGVEITRITDELPLPDDIQRVQRRLAGTG
jgi:Protein of unknown function (DUF3349)